TSSQLYSNILIKNNSNNRCLFIISKVYVNPSSDNCTPLYGFVSTNPDFSNRFTISLTDGGLIFKYWDNVLFETKDRKSTRLNSSHVSISYAVFCLKKKK